MAQGHLIPMTDIAKLFALRPGDQVSVVTTPINDTRITSTINRHRTCNITIHLLQFPCSEAGLPDCCETLDLAISLGMFMAFINALTLLQQPFELLVERHRPDCIISDMFLPWTVDVADKLGVPRLVFNGSSFFHLCVYDGVDKYFSHQNESQATDTEPFLVPKLPHLIEITRSQLPDFMTTRTPSTEVMEKVIEADSRSYGVVMNSFYELEPEYVKHYREEVRGSITAWHIGPVSLCNRDQMEMAERGNKASIDPNQCLDWLGSREPGSVIYVCLGSLFLVGGVDKSIKNIKMMD